MIQKAYECTMELTMEQMQKIFGQHDLYIKKIERDLQVEIIDRNGTVKITGDKSHVDKARSILEQLMILSERGNEIEEQNVDYAITMGMEDEEEVIAEIDRDLICHTISGKPIKPKTLGQKKYVDAIGKNTLVFGIGPAGTGKTFLAVAMAVTALKQKQVSRIILTRPAVEAGEKLGFLPGDLQSKIDPYLRPLYDALGELLGGEGAARNAEKGVIEVCPLAYMRGRTLDDAFIILDEAQNTTPEQMKMFLTRLGNNSKAVVTGDVTQIDLPRNCKSGLVEAIQVLQNIKDIEIFRFSRKDVVRHPLVQKIIEAYETRTRDDRE